MAITIFNLINDTKHKTFFEKLLSMKTVEVQMKEEAKEGPAAEEERSGSMLQRLFSFLHKTCEIHVLMNILTVAAAFEAVFKAGVDSRVILFLFYGGVVPLITIVKVTYVITRRGVDQEFEIYFREVGLGRK